MSGDDQRAEVRRILQSPEFRRAPKLQRFLELVCAYHFQNRSAEISEFVIATKAFGKGPDFVPGNDSLVRVQAREIRRRLKEYYQNEGRSSRLVLDIPIGRYTPVFTPVEVASSAHRAPSLRSVRLILAGTVLACAILLITPDHERRLLTRTMASPAGLHATAMSPPLARLWGRFLDSDVATILVVSNPGVSGCPDPNKAAADCEDEFTGMGEAVAIHLITGVFRSSREPLVVKQSRMVTADDVTSYNLILLGGKAVNIWTRRLGPDLSLSELDSETVSKAALDGKASQTTQDRGLLALRKHPDTGHWVLFLYGRHTHGTHAAAEASTDARFLEHLKWPGEPFPDSFHVLVSVSVNDGVPALPLPLAVRVP